MLQAYTDDSGNIGQGTTCLFAGFIASAEAWAEFSDRWEAALKFDPAIPFLKMSNANARVREFAGWTREARDKKIHSLIDVLVSTKIEYATVSVLINDAHRGMVAGLTPLERQRWSIAEPFFTLLTSFMKTCMIHQRKKGIKEPIDFIFDSASPNADKLKKFVSIMMPGAPRSIRDLNLMPNDPVFRDERLVKPLQAADMFANQIRDLYERRAKDATSKASPFLQRIVGEFPGTFAWNEYDKENLQKLVSTARRALKFVLDGHPTTINQRHQVLRDVLDRLEHVRDERDSH